MQVLTDHVDLYGLAHQLPVAFVRLADVRARVAEVDVHEDQRSFDVSRVAYMKGHREDTK